jgi:hypothetical protein
MKKFAMMAFAMLLISSCKEKSSEVEVDEVQTVTPADSIIPQDTTVMETATEAAPEPVEAAQEIKVESKTAKVEYATFGAKFSEEKALTKSEMMKKYANLKKGDTISVKFKSTIKDVCKKKGCWMKMELADNSESFVRFKDYGFFVPLNADNSDAIISGRAYLDVVSVDELRHYAEDGGKSKEEIEKITKPKVTYAFEADGVMIQK